MKKFFYLSIFSIMLVSFYGFSGKSSMDFSNTVNTVNTAQLNDDFSIVLNESQPISDTYEADVSHFRANMPNKVEAEKFISNFAKPYIQLSLDLDNLKVLIILESNVKTSKWSVAQWNDSLKSN